jgi:hypothetical protein
VKAERKTKIRIPMIGHFKKDKHLSIKMHKRIKGETWKRNAQFSK